MVGDKMIKLKNYSNLITTREINKCLNIINRRYLNLNIQITIYDNIEQTLNDKISIGENTFCKVKEGIVNGAQYFEWGWNIIRIFPFNHSNKNNIKLQIVYDILHEIRHAFQRKYAYKNYLADGKNYHEKGVEWSKLWIEKDAIKFQSKMFNRHRNKINNILDVLNDNWYTEYQIIESKI